MMKRLLGRYAKLPVRSCDVIHWLKAIHRLIVYKALL